MIFRPSLLVLGLAVGVATAALVACASGGDDGSSTDSAITGTISGARACAVRDAYAAAGLDAFTDVSIDQLPAAVRSRLWGGDAGHLDALVKFDVPTIGTVFIAELNSQMTFYSATGATLLVADSDPFEVNSLWLLPSGAALACPGELPDAGVILFDGGTVDDPDASSDGGLVEIPQDDSGTTPLPDAPDASDGG